jgi:hypothetical protein
MEMDWMLIGAAILGFCLQRIIGDTLVNLFWSIVSYLGRGEYNDDGNESTVDRFMKPKLNEEGFTHCYILQYKFWCVIWGFKYEGGFVVKKTNWLYWALTRNDRYPMPTSYKENDLDSLFRILMKK